MPEELTLLIALKTVATSFCHHKRNLAHVLAFKRKTVTLTEMLEGLVLPQSPFVLSALWRQIQPVAFL